MYLFYQLAVIMGKYLPKKGKAYKNNECRNNYTLSDMDIELSRCTSTANRADQALANRSDDFSTW